MSANPIQLVPALPRRELLWLKDGKRCHWCKCATRLSDDHAWDAATTEHIIPRYKGGTNDDSNLVSACNRCNNRRNHEDARGLPDGSLIGRYKLGQKVPSPNIGKAKYKSNALTKDEKNAIVAGLPPPMQQQRDQALKSAIDAHAKIKMMMSELEAKTAKITKLEEMVKGQTISNLLREKLAAWLLR
jgi:hypothetical protein